MYKVVVFLLIVASSAVHGSAYYGLQSGSGLEDEISFCQGCRSMVTFATSFNETSIRDDYKGLLKNFCELYYPVSTDYQQGPCPMFVESFYFALDHINPIYHCDQIGACESTLLASTDTKLASVKDGGVFCQACEELVSQLKAQLEDEDYVDQIRRQVRQFCNYLHVVDKDKECDVLFNRYINQAIFFIRSINPNRYCRSIQLCKPKPPKVEKKLPSLANFMDFGIETNVEIDGVSVKNFDRRANKLGAQCTFCKRFVQQMFKFLKENRTEESVRNGLDEICKLVYREGPKFDQCEHLVATYSKEMVEILVDETDPELICMLLEQCTYQKLRSNELETPEPISMSQFISMLDPQIPIGSFRTCLECKLFIKYLQTEAEDPETQEELKNWLLENLCDTLQTSEMKKSCSYFVKEKSKAFFDAIANQLDPQIACSDIGACRKGKNILLMDFLKVPEISNSAEWSKKIVEKLWSNSEKMPSIAPPVTDSRVGNQICDQCVSIVTKIDEYLSSHSIDHDVSILIDQVCNKLSNESLKRKCTLLVRAYGEEIIQAITSMESPNQLCSRLSLC